MHMEWFMLVLKLQLKFNITFEFCFELDWGSFALFLVFGHVSFAPVQYLLWFHVLHVNYLCLAPIVSLFTALKFR